MQVKEIDINTGKNQEIWNLQKKVQNLIFRWSYHSDLLYKSILDFMQLWHKDMIHGVYKLYR